MITKKNLPSSRVQGHLQKRIRPLPKEAEIEALVKAGVERFILKDATIEDFLKSIRVATQKEFVYSHQLTKSKFTRIVKQAIKERNRRRKKSS